MGWDMLLLQKEWIRSPFHRFFVIVMTVIVLTSLFGYLLNPFEIEFTCKEAIWPGISSILLRNIAVFSLLLVGYLTYGILTLTILGLNGFLLGYFLKGHPFSLVIRATFPHAIPELISFMLISATALQASIDLRNNSDPLIIIKYKNKIVISFILLLIAALIEWKLTPIISCGW